MLRYTGMARRVLGVLLSVLFLVACDPSDSSAPEPTPTLRPILQATVTMGGERGELKLGFAVSLSGENAAIAASQRSGAQLAIDEINSMENGPIITALFEDTGGQPVRALDVYRKLIEESTVDAVIGPTLGSEARQADPYAQASKVLVLGVSGTASGITELGDYIFSASLDEAEVIAETVRVAKETLGVERVALLYAEDDAFSRSVSGIFRAELQESGIEITAEQTFQTADTDFKDQLTEIMADPPDAIVLAALARPARRIIEQARSVAGTDADMLIIGGSVLGAAELTGNIDASEGVVAGVVWSPASANEASVQFVRNYRTVTGKDPDLYAAQAYAGVYIVHDAARRADIEGKTKEEARSSLRDALRSTGDLPTILGDFSFTDNREAAHAPVVQIFRNGAFEAVR